jgi:hypothetical protein
MRASIWSFKVLFSARDREFDRERGGHWDKDKCCETFNPLGPFLLTEDNKVNPHKLIPGLWVSGPLRQSSSMVKTTSGIDNVIRNLTRAHLASSGRHGQHRQAVGVALWLPDYYHLSDDDVVEFERN